MNHTPESFPILAKVLAGSHAYGTNIETSDVDYRGLFCSRPVNVRTPFFPVKEIEDTAEEDTKFYELSHFMKLCLDCNPNIIELLWVDRADIITTSAGYELLRDNREKLLSSKVAFTFTGYAVSQINRIKGHNKWINCPQPEQPPKPCEFLTVVQWFGTDKMLKVDLTKFNQNHQLIPYGNDIYGVYPNTGYTLWDNNGNINNSYDGDRTSLPVPLMLVKFNKPQYVEAKEKHSQYWNWKRNRNEARGALEEQFGMDTKHAMHLVRLLRMGEEILTEGIVRVKRPDAEELLAIRNGAWTYDQLVKYAEEKDKLIREELYKKTHLRKKPDVKFAAQLLMDVQDSVWTEINQG